jgi:hypothetical protein
LFALIGKLEFKVLITVVVAFEDTIIETAIIVLGFVPESCRLSATDSHTNSTLTILGNSRQQAHININGVSAIVRLEEFLLRYGTEEGSFSVFQVLPLKGLQETNE